MQLPFDYLVERAARRTGVPSWVMFKQPLYYMGLALACERIDMRAQEISDKIAARRGRGAGGDDKDDPEG